MAVVLKSRKMVPVDDESIDKIRALRMRKADKTLGILVVVYLLCWLPFCICWSFQSAINYFSVN